MSFQPEERYWTDYLRIALPVIGLLLLLGLLWYWAAALIGGGSPDPAPTATTALGAVTPVNAPTPTPSASPTAPAIVATQGPPPTPTETINPTEPPRTPGPTPAPGAGNTDPECANLPTYQAGETVVTTGDVNLRQEASTQSPSLGVLASGTELRITDRFVDQPDCDWWPVTDPSTGRSGFVRENLLRAAAQ